MKLVFAWNVSSELKSMPKSSFNCGPEEPSAFVQISQPFAQISQQQEQFIQMLNETPGELADISGVEGEVGP